MSSPPPPEPPPSGVCISDEIFRGLLTMPIEASHADASTVSIAVFVFLILLGLGLLFLGVCFERLFHTIAFGTVFFLATFVGTYAFLIVENEDQCVGPLIIAVVATLLAALAIYILQRLLALLSPLFNFLTGFTLGALGMLVLFIVIEQNSEWSMLVSTEKLPLYAYAAGTVLVAIIGGIGALYFLPVVDVLLRCAAGGFAFSSGVCGLVSTLDHPLEEYVFLLLFAGSAGVGALFQLCYARRKKAAEAKEKPTEASSLIKS